MLDRVAVIQAIKDAEDGGVSVLHTDFSGDFRGVSDMALEEIKNLTEYFESGDTMTILTKTGGTIVIIHQPTSIINVTMEDPHDYYS